jgi:organic radical activating enzyme
MLAPIILSHYKAPTQPLVVLTGGEPFRQPIAKLIYCLERHGAIVQIETNGTLPPDTSSYAIGYGPVDWEDITIVCSPKTGSINKDLAPFIDVYKYVLTAGQTSSQDGLPIRALDHPAKPQLARPPEDFPREKILVQPLDPDPERHHLELCIWSAFKFGYTISLQQHKIIGVP